MTPEQKAKTLESLGAYLTASTWEKATARLEFSDSSGDVDAIVAILMGLEDATSDHAQFCAEDERYLRSEEFTQRAEAFAACSEAIIKIWED